MDQAGADHGRHESGAALASRIDRRLSWAGFLANGVGALVVFAFLGFLLPQTIDSDEYATLVVRGVIVFALYMAVALPLGRLLVQRRFFAPLERWLRAEQPATERERMSVLRYPLDWAVTSSVFWVVAAALFSLLNASVSRSLAAATAVTIVLGGVTACALQYLLIERIVRPVTARALAGGRPPQATTPGVAARLTMAWMLATGVPLLGMVAVAVTYLAGGDLGRGQVVVTTLFLASLALAVGLFAMVVATRSVADPVGAVGRALQRVEHGDFDVRVRVDDGSEVGLLQAGFNRMVAGLAERERLREAFGIFVDPGLAERVLLEGTDLAGEEVEISVLFLDVRGFTTLAERTGAREVVARLNDLYERVVPTITSHGGHANKFIGDGMLAVFGAPERLPDHADCAVAAALEIARVIRETYRGELRVGLGVNSGRVLVGTVGGGGRLDFTVIGDPVNTAARVEAATRQTDDELLITDATRRLLLREHGEWEQRPAIALKGKAEHVPLYAPVAPAGS